MNGSHTLSSLEAGIAANAGPASMSEGEGTFPLTLGQEAIWVAHQIAPATSAYNMPFAWRLSGDLDLRALQQSLDLLAARHETLRTTFLERDGQPFQLIASHRPFALEFVDLSKCPDPQSVAETSLAAEAKRPLDLRRGPLARAVLYRLAEQEHVFLLNVHHIVSDEWSVGILLREIAEIYRATRAGARPALPELPIQFADFAVWQREHSGDAVEADLEYWKKQLCDPIAPVALPVDEPRSKHPGFFEGATNFTVIAPDTTAGLRQLANQSGCTLYMVLLGVFNTLLHRYNRQTDLIVGSPMANRRREETENLIGLLVNTHALRTDLSGDPTFVELLARVKEVVVQADTHQTIPVERIVTDLRLGRQTGSHPLFNVVFGLQTAMTERWSLPEITSRAIDLDNGGAKFDWTLLLTETAGGLKVRSEFSRRVFQGVGPAELVRRFELLSRAVVAAPHKHLSELPITTADERLHLISAASAAQPRRPSHLECLPALFEQAVRRNPQAPALTFEGKHWSYSDLNRQANQLAHYLKRRSVRPGDRVALCLDRTPAMVVAILGTLKAGAAYVPIEPACPADRLKFIVEDVAPSAILTQAGLGLRFGHETNCAVICMDEVATEISAENASNPPPANRPENIAYIIYTSGSTGRPKGVLVSHANVVRLFQSTEQWFGFTAADVWTLFHSYAFDFSVWELWGALLYGGRLVLVPYLVSRSPGDFYQLLASEKVTVLNQTPSAFRQLIWAEASARETQPLALREVIFGGEALELKSLKPWFERHGDQKPRLVNMYGITETTVHVTYRIIREADVEAELGSVIGVPIPDLQLYLLDEHLEPVPAGVPGEICVGGAGVAQGYMNRPELSAARFVPNPFRAGTQERMYRSGDLARRTFSGELEYLGRMDDQVKIRGFRVEIGEIESALNSHPDVRESVVTARESTHGDKQLIAHIVPKGVGLTTDCLRRHLCQKLPEYMIPSSFVQMPSLPLTANGKVNRSALPAPALKAQERQGVPPRDEMEKLVTGTWEELLGRRGITVEENFFYAGGHSLLATQVMSRLSAALGVDLSVRTLFDAPTVEQLAVALRNAKAAPLTRHAIKVSRPELKAAELLERLDELSDSEVEELLKSLEQKPLLK